MPFEKGNQLYQLREKEQPKSYKLDMPEDLNKEFNAYAKHKLENPEYIHTPTASNPEQTTRKSLPLTLQGLAAWIGVSSVTLTNWSKPEHIFADVMAKIKTQCEASQLEGAMIGKYNAPIVIRNLQLGDKIDHTSSDGSLKAPTRIELIAPTVDDDDSKD